MPSSIRFKGFEEYYHTHPVKKNDIVQFHDTVSSSNIKIVEVALVVEETIELSIANQWNAFILLTPVDLEALIVGYLICEGIVPSISSIETIECYGEKISVTLKDSNQNMSFFPEIRTSGCIGIRMNTDDFAFSIESNLKITPKLIFSCQEKIKKMSTLWSLTGGTHMTGLFRQSGEIAYFAEDVGRHNTIDKVIGAALMKDENLSDLFAVTSGRISSAMVSKLARARVPIFVSNTAPMANGIFIGKKTGMTIVGFSRDPQFKIYSAPERIIKSSSF